MKLKENMPKTILIVDDDASILTLLRESLEDLSFKVFEAKDGIEAINIIRTEKVDCIVTDISMPQCDGPSFIKTIQAEGRHIPFFFISAYLDCPREDLNKYKPRAIVFKPFDFEELAMLVKNHMMRL